MTLQELLLGIVILALVAIPFGNAISMVLDLNESNRQMIEMKTVAQEDLRAVQLDLAVFEEDPSDTEIATLQNNATIHENYTINRIIDYPQKLITIKVNHNKKTALVYTVYQTIP